MSDSDNAARPGNAGLAFIFGGIGTPDGTDVSVDIDLPRMELPGPPKMPTQPQVVPLETGLPEPALPMTGVNPSNPVR